MQRICFTLSVRSDRVAEYERRHQKVWPDMQEALRATGWNNYTLFLRPDGLAVGYVESPDFERAQQQMGELEVNTRSQSQMAELVQTQPGRRVDESFALLRPIFRLE